MKQGGITLACGAALIALTLTLAPALGAPSPQKAKKKPAMPTLMAGGFTPAVADPRLAAAFAGRGLSGANFRFTPTPTENRSKALKVAVRVRASTPAEARRVNAEPVSASAAIPGLTPTAYNLGVAVGWKRFALSGDVAKVDTGLMPGGREAAEVGVSYSGKKFTGRVQLGAERTDGKQPQILADESYSLDVGGSYSIARNVAVTGGVRYKLERDRLQPLAGAGDELRDSQAVYIGTAFRF